MTVPDLDPELVAYVKELADRVPSPDETSSNKMTPERQELLNRLLEPTTESTESAQAQEQDGESENQENQERQERDEDKESA